MHPSGSEKDYFANGATQVKMKGKDDIPDWVLSATGNLCERDRLSPRRISEDTVGHVREHCNTRREEYEAFQVGKLLQRRTTITEDGSVLFRLLLPSTPNSPAVLHNGNQHLCLDCLRDSDD